MLQAGRLRTTPTKRRVPLNTCTGDHKCACIYIYIHTHTHIYIYIFIYLCLYVYVCIYMYIHIYRYICMYIYIYVYTVRGSLQFLHHKCLPAHVVTHHPVIRARRTTPKATSQDPKPEPPRPKASESLEPQWPEPKVRPETANNTTILLGLGFRVFGALNPGQKVESTVSALTTWTSPARFLANPSSLNQNRRFRV